MGRERKADIEAERDRLAKRLEEAAGELERLAEDIETAIPKLSSQRTRLLLSRQVDRARSLAVALAEEGRDPDPTTGKHLLNARKTLRVAIVAVLLTVLTGAGEAAGSDGFHALTDLAERHLPGSASDGQEAEPPETDDWYPDGSAALALLLGATDTQPYVLAKDIRVPAAEINAWKAGMSHPSQTELLKILAFFTDIEAEHEIDRENVIDAFAALKQYVRK